MRQECNGKKKKLITLINLTLLVTNEKFEVECRKLWTAVSNKLNKWSKNFLVRAWNFLFNIFHIILVEKITENNGNTSDANTSTPSLTEEKILNNFLSSPSIMMQNTRAA